MRRAAMALAAFVVAAPAHAQLPGAGGNAQDNAKPIAIEADNGIEWQQTNRVYIAHGHAKAKRGDDTVNADTLYAYYREPAPATPSQKPAPTPAPKSPASAATDPFTAGSTQIYRLEADGNVVFTSPTQTVLSDHAVYDVDKAVLVATGKGLKLTTPRDVVTATDSLEWYDQKQYGVARGNALAVRGDRQIRGNVLVARLTKLANGQSHISRIDATGDVIVSMPGQIARGDAGVYNLDTGIATLTGHVRLTRGQSELRGRYAVVDTNTKVSRILSAPPGAKLVNDRARVEGLIVRPPASSQKPASQTPASQAPAAPAPSSQGQAHP